jgi:hypothetical protein
MKTKKIMTTKISDESLKILIEGLETYKANGTIDPWVLSDGTLIEPLDALKELQEWRKHEK